MSEQTRESFKYYAIKVAILENKDIWQSFKIIDT